MRQELKIEKYNDYYIVTGFVDVAIGKSKSVEVDGEIYTNTKREIVTVNLKRDFLKYINDQECMVDWSYAEITAFVSFNIKPFNIYFPYSFNYGYHPPLYANYSENFVINLIMNLADNIFKIKNVEFFCGKNESWATLPEIMISDVLKYNRINTTITGYGFNNCVYACVKLKELFNYDYKEIIRRSKYGKFFINMFNINVDKLDNPEYITKLMSDILMKKAIYKYKNK